MKAIKTAAIIGMGALGLLFGRQIVLRLGRDALYYVMDEVRLARHQKDVYTINGVPAEFDLRASSAVIPADLVIVATKFGGLREAMDVMRNAVDSHTTIISLLNGISSEEILAEKYDCRQIIDCVAIGMDAVREGSDLVYRHMGRLQIGARDEVQKPRLERLAAFFAKAGIPYELIPDMRRAMWNKFMLNVGINQTCMVYETTYGGALAEGSEARRSMVQAMQEVIAVARAEKVDLSEADLRRNLATIAGLNPEGYPSMRQDALARRKSEVELFGGTVVRLGEKHGIDTPVNSRYCEWIREMEKGIE